MISDHEKVLRAPLKRVRGLGSAKEGVSHWWQMRLTSVALIPLTLWLIIRLQTIDASCAIIGGCFYSGPGPAPSSMEEEPAQIFQNWLSSPLDAFLLILLTIIMFHHAASGIQVVLEDYVHSEGRKLVSIYTVKALCLLMGGACVLSILKIALGHP